MTAEIPITKKTEEKIITKFFLSKKSKKAPNTVSVIKQYRYSDLITYNIFMFLFDVQCSFLFLLLKNLVWKRNQSKYFLHLPQAYDEYFYFSLLQ